MEIFVVHNHPYIYNAYPSLSDCQSLKAIIEEISDIENLIRSIGRKGEISLIDCSIVTDYDYWSFVQSN